MKKMRVGWVIFLLTALLVFALTAKPVQASEGQPFKDVAAGDWYHGYVTLLQKKGVVKGYGTTGEFRPGNKLVREHAAKMVALAAELAYRGKEADFPDVDKKGEMSPYIAALKDKGAIQGFPSGLFKPQDRIRKGHAVKIVALAFDLKEGGKPGLIADLPSDREVSRAIRILESNGIIQGEGTPKLYQPDEDMDRAEFARIICYAMAVQAIQKAEEDPNPKNIEDARDLVDELPPDPGGSVKDLEDRLDDLEDEEEDPQPPYVPVTGLSLSPPEAFLAIGESLPLEAKITPAHASNPKIQWSSTDTSIATVEEGLVTAVTSGQVTIMATSQDGGHEAECLILAGIVTVRTPEELTAALAHPGFTIIQIDGILGDLEDYGQYTIDRENVIIRGMEGAKVFGAFCIRANGITIENLQIQNSGCEDDGEASYQRTAILILAENASIRGNILSDGRNDHEGYSNGILIMNSKVDNPLTSFVIENNTFYGHGEGWDETGSSASIWIIENQTVPFLEARGYRVTAQTSDYETLLDNNVFLNNSLDLVHYDFSPGYFETIYPYKLEGLEIEGTPAVGETLTAKVSPAEATVYYQWCRHSYDPDNGIPIEGATEASYVVKEADAGQWLTVRVQGYRHYIEWYMRRWVKVLPADGG